MSNYIKQLRRLLIGKPTLIAVDVLPQAADGITITANAADWNETGTAVTVGTSNATYPCGIAAVTVSNFSDIAADWEGELQIITGTAGGTVIARVPIAADFVSGVGIVPATAITLPKIVVVDPATAIYVRLVSADAVADTCNVKVTLAINV